MIKKAVIVPDRKALNAPLRRRIRAYQELARTIRERLDAEPKEWGKFQSVFNYEINQVFQQIMEFEKENMLAGREDAVYKLKRIFTHRIRQEFLHGDYTVRSLEKPYGYAGDFQIIDDIYSNEPKTLGFDRLYDNYFQMSSISVAVRNRKEDFKKIVLQTLKERAGKPVRIMNLGCGPCRDVAELAALRPQVLTDQVSVDCVDNDTHALAHGQKLLSGMKNINFKKENAVRMALKKDITQIFPESYDLIFSTGLFDYFDDRVTLRLIKNLKAALKPGGKLAISDVRDKFSNPSVHFMEWVGDWNLIYREDDRFRQLFLDAGFKKEHMTIGYEQQGILQYLIALNC